DRDAADHVVRHVVEAASRWRHRCGALDPSSLPRSDAAEQTDAETDPHAWLHAGQCCSSLRRRARAADRNRLARDPWSARRGADTVARWLQESRSARENTMFDRFTDRAKEALFFALDEATFRNQRYIGTEHILLGLVREGSGTAANVLRNLNADAERIRRAIDMVIKASPSMPATGLLPFLLPAKNALAWSVEEARESRHNY